MQLFFEDQEHEESLSMDLKCVGMAESELISFPKSNMLFFSLWGTLFNSLRWQDFRSYGFYDYFIYLVWLLKTI